jgi:hypothetical protein
MYTGEEAIQMIKQMPKSLLEHPKKAAEYWGTYLPLSKIWFLDPKTAPKGPGLQVPFWKPSPQLVSQVTKELLKQKSFRAWVRTYLEGFRTAEEEEDTSNLDDDENEDDGDDEDDNDDDQQGGPKDRRPESPSPEQKLDTYETLTPKIMPPTQDLHPPPQASAREQQDTDTTQIPPDAATNNTRAENQDAEMQDVSQLANEPQRQENTAQDQDIEMQEA